jgi:hypothetical protein
MINNISSKTGHFISSKLFALVATSLISAVCFVGVANAAPVVGFDPGRIIDDDVFAAYTSMNVSQIQSFLNSKVPSCDTNGAQTSEFGGGTRAQWGAAHGHPAPFVCLRDYSENGKSSSQIIYDISQQYRINPQVLMVVLQKEQGLVTDTWPLDTQYKTATGYGCPDTAACDTQYYGFTNQVTWSAKMFRAILDASSTWFTPYVMGNNLIKWNPSASCGSSTVNITTRATQALYNYTPYQPNQAALNAGYGNGDSCSSYGNRNFYLYFTDWFGSTQGNWYYSCHYGANIPGTGSGRTLLSSRIGGAPNSLSLFMPNNTGSGCAEVHTWAANSLQTWINHTATNSYTFNPNDSTVASVKISHTQSRYYKIDYRNTGSGNIEIHGWDPTVQHWAQHAATNYGSVDPATTELLFADSNGDGADELNMINLTGTASGMVEVHRWTPDLQGWVLHTATALPSIDPTKGKIIALDGNGDGRAEFAYIKFADTGSGMVEVHIFTPDFKGWTLHAATNLPTASYDSSKNDIIAADQDGDGKDALIYVKYSGTGSGMVELHGWAPNLQSWSSHIATNQPAV